MFVPQQHPARDLQDTFYVKDPLVAGDPPTEYYDRVKEVHEVGGYGSIGYRAPFSKDDSKKLLLRTHTTAVSADILYNLANQEGGFKPAKFFSIDRVFRYAEVFCNVGAPESDDDDFLSDRNEATDATHLAEFHQVEGVVADYDINLGHLMGM